MIKIHLLCSFASFFFSIYCNITTFFTTFSTFFERNFSEMCWIECAHMLGFGNHYWVDIATTDYNIIHWFVVVFGAVFGSEVHLFYACLRS